MTTISDQTASGLSLLPHQEAGVEWLLGHPRALLADAPGLGKTVQAGDYLSRLLVGQRHSADRGSLWLTEAALIGQTVSELTRFFPDLQIASSVDPALAAKAPSAKAARQHAERFPNGPDVLVASYDWANRRLPDDTAARPLVVLDEASAFKAGPGRPTWETVERLCRHATRVVALTATPLETNPCESWAILAAIGAPALWGRQVFERDYVSWEAAYQLADGRWVPRKPHGFLPGKDALFRGYLSQVCLRRTAVDAGLTLPRRVGERYRLVALSRHQQGEYDYWSRKQGLFGHKRRERAGRISTSGHSSLVHEAVTEVHRRPGQKVVVYAETLDLVKALHDALTARTIAHEVVEGSDAKGARQRAVRTFLDPTSGVDVLVGSRVIEYGLNLQEARVLLSLDASYNPAREQQREGRICRIGSPHETYEHITLLPDTELNRRKVQTLDRRQQVQTQGGLA